MTDYLYYHLLEDEALRQHAKGDFAAQAETLMEMAGLAHKDHEENETFDLAHGLYAQATEAYQQASNVRGMAEALYAMCRYFNFRDQPTEAVGLYQTVIDLYGQLGDLTKQMALYIEMGRRFGWVSVWAYEQALRCAETLGDLAKQAEICHLLSAAHFLPTSRVYEQQAISLYQQLGDRIAEGVFYLTLSDQVRRHHYDLSKEYLLKAYALFKPLADARLFIQTLHRLMDLAKTYSDYPTLRQYHEERLAFPHTDDEKLKAYSLLTHIAAQNGFFADARYAYQQCVVLSAKRGGEAWYYWTWGEMEYQQAGRHAMGIALCQWAVTLLQNSYGVVVYQKKLDKMRQEVAYD
jgi:tetratricopeptide (TPR) repeat protein